MDIPFVKFALPVAVLYLFYWALIVNPWVDESAASSGTQTANGLSADAVRDLVDQSKKLLQEKKYEQALPLMLRVHKAYPESHIYIEHLATIYAALGRFGEEAQMWEKFLQYAPMPAEGCPQIGQAYEKQNKLVEAEKAFERCYIIEPNSDNILFYAHAVEMKGDYKKAAALYEQGVKRSPNYGDISVGLARVQMFTGQSAKAKERVLAVLKRSPDNVDALLVAGMACTRTGDFALARKYLEHGLKLSPSYRDLQQAMAHLRASSRPPKQALALPPGAKP
ncbi:MAG: tetratricopeptide repeat protein [Acidobacteriota bacterium]|nr:tetratricopeptide repeat protein [Acidobacteriota bacterium]